MVTQRTGGKPGTIPALTSIRFWAAIVVLFYHYNIILKYPFPIPFLAENGRSAVSLFFILSGYILVHNYYEWFALGVTAERYREYARARFARVYPMHLVALGLMTILVLYLWIAHYGFLRQELQYEPTPKLLFFSWLANLLLLQVYVPQPAFENLWNTPSWSIACEAVSYLLFPFFVATAIGRSRRISGLLGLTVLLWVFEMGLCAAFLKYSQNVPPELQYTTIDWIGYRLPFFRVWEFFIGCAMAAAWKRQCDGEGTHFLLRPLQSTVGRNATLILALLVMAGIAESGSVTTGKAHEAISFLQLYALYTPPFALAILALGSGRTFLSPLLENRLMVLLGESSYSLYIIHWIPMYCVLYCMAYGLLPQNSAVSGWTILLTVVLSVLFFKCVEGPARRALRGSPTRQAS